MPRHLYYTTSEECTMSAGSRKTAQKVPAICFVIQKYVIGEDKYPRISISVKIFSTISL